MCGEKGPFPTFISFVYKVKKLFGLAFQFRVPVFIGVVQHA